MPSTPKIINHLQDPLIMYRSLFILSVPHKRLQQSFYLAEAFDSALAAPDHKLHVSAEGLKDLKALPGYDTFVNRDGKFLRELIEVAE